MENEDDVLSVLRHFDWNQRKVEDKWFLDVDNHRKEIGLDYD